MHQAVQMASLGDLSEFRSLSDTIYLNHAAISPPSSRVKRGVAKTLEEFAQRGSGAFLEFVDERIELKTRLARLLGAPSADGSDFAWMSNTTRGVQTIAHAFPWRMRDRVLLFQGEFPTNVIPWLQAAERHQLEIVWASLEPIAHRAGVDWEPIENQLRAGVRLVAISAVQFQTGLRVPLDQLSRLCQRYDAALFVDGIQACGAVPIPLEHIDFLSSGGHKWMMAVEGAGFIYVHPRWHHRLKSEHAGWLSVEDPLDFLFADRSVLRYDKPIRSELSAFEGGAQSAVSYAALSASISALEQLGVNTIYDYIQSLLNALEKGLLTRGMISARLTDTARRSTILSVRPHPEDPWDITQWAMALQARGVIVSTPDGWLRFSPHWPNHLGQIEEVLSLIDQIKC